MYAQKNSMSMIFDSQSGILVLFNSRQMPIEQTTFLFDQEFLVARSSSFCIMKSSLKGVSAQHEMLMAFPARVHPNHDVVRGSSPSSPMAICALPMADDNIRESGTPLPSCDRTLIGASHHVTQNRCQTRVSQHLEFQEGLHPIIDEIMDTVVPKNIGDRIQK